MKLETEKIRENTRRGTRTYWVAYPAWVASYGHASDRASRAWGAGRTRAEALADAEKETGRA